LLVLLFFCVFCVMYFLVIVMLIYTADCLEKLLIARKNFSPK